MLLVGVPVVATAQVTSAADPRPGRANVEGVVTDHHTMTAIAGAEVRLASLVEDSDSPAPLITSGDGRFAFDNVSAGRYVLEIGTFGYEPREDTLLVEPDTEVRVTVDLSATPIPLDPFVVEVTRRGGSRVMEALEARRTRLHGTFIDRAAIDRSSPNRISDLLRMVTNTQVVGGQLRNLRDGIATVCIMPVFVDGVRAAGGIDTSVSPDMVEAIEVYTSIAETPPQFGPSRCGAVVIWLRPAVRPDPATGVRRSNLLRGVAALAAFGTLVFLGSR